MICTSPNPGLVSRQKVPLTLLLVVFFLSGVHAISWAQTIYSTNFENFTATNLQGWTIDNGVWSVGTPNTGPDGAHDGLQCAGTGINQNYPTNTASRFISPNLNLPSIKSGQQITLRFWQWFNWDTNGNNGYGQVQISTWNGTQWGPWGTVSPTYTGSSNGWQYAGTTYTPIDLSGFAGKRIRFAFNHNGGSYSAPGWFIDDVSVNLESVVDMPLNTTVTFEDFTATDWKGWTGWNSNGVWNIGTPNTGPDAAYDSLQCAGTGINNNYPTNTWSLLASAPFTLPTIKSGQQITLRFWQWFNWDTNGNQGNGQVYASTWNGSQWGPFNPISPVYGGSSNGWHYAGTSYTPIDLSGFAGRRIRLGFNHYGGSYSAPGWFIDNVSVNVEPVVDMPLNTTVTFEDFTATDWKGWTGWNNNGVWNIGTPNTGPDAAYDGLQCAGTGINNNYPTNTWSMLTSPAFTLPTIKSGQKINLRFWHWYDWDTNGNQGNGQVYVSAWNGSQWGPFNPIGPQYNGSSNGWLDVSKDIDLSIFAGRRIRFGFNHYGGSYSAPGWFIDDVSIAISVIAITDFTPKTGPVGTRVTITGQLFTGATSVMFNGTPATFTVVNDTTITANVPSGASTGTITITGPTGTATSTANFVLSGINLTLFPSTVTGGVANSIGIVTLATSAPAGGTKVQLSSSYVSAATVPAFVTVPTGKTSAAFTIITKTVQATKTVQITAAASKTAAALLTVQPVPVAMFSILPDTVSGGDNAIGILTLTNVASTPTTVTLLSSNTHVATVPVSVVIPANTSTMTFNIDTKAVKAITSIMITATVGGQSLLAPLTVTP